MHKLILNYEMSLVDFTFSFYLITTVYWKNYLNWAYLNSHTGEKNQFENAEKNIIGVALIWCLVLICSASYERYR